MSLYHEAAEFLIASPSAGGSLKARVFKQKNLKSPPNQLYALVLETSKWSPVLKEVIDRAEVLKHERKLSPALALLLVHDFLIAKGGIALPQSHGLRQSIERHKGRLQSELTRARLRRKTPSMEALRQQVEKDAAGEEAGYPRWVRVNAIKSSVEEQLETTFARYERALSLQQVINGSHGGGEGEGGGGSSTAAAKHVFIDPHVPNLLAVTQGTDLTKSEAYAAGKIILQDKASCFPAYLLSPGPEDGDVVDACAAPGNKTTHLAGILHSRQPDFKSEPQTIYAFEKDSRRAKTLEKMVQMAGSTKITKIAGGQDFLQVDPLQDKYQNVGALLLDPSCSGSGIVGRDSMPEVHLPEAPGGGANKKEGQEKHPKGQGRKRKHAEVEEKKQDVLVDDDGNEVVVKSEKDLQARLDALSSFQLILLLHAFRFPAARKITYSTCSVHAEENESVVMQALQSDVAKQRGWRIMRRDEQVTGMREWPVRGLPDACERDTDIAQGCIRSYKDDGHGVMGFFVAGFVRDGGEQLANEEDDDGPYMRDEDGVILRDVTGMPVLKATGVPVELVPRSDEEEEQEEEEEEEWAGLGD